MRGNECARFGHLALGSQFQGVGKVGASIDLLWVLTQFGMLGHKSAVIHHLAQAEYYFVNLTVGLDRFLASHNVVQGGQHCKLSVQALVGREGAEVFFPPIRVCTLASRQSRNRVGDFDEVPAFWRGLDCVHHGAQEASHILVVHLRRARHFCHRLAGGGDLCLAFGFDLGNCGGLGGALLEGAASNALPVLIAGDKLVQGRALAEGAFGVLVDNVPDVSIALDSTNANVGGHLAHLVNRAPSGALCRHRLVLGPVGRLLVPFFYPVIYICCVPRAYFFSPCPNFIKIYIGNGLCSCPGNLLCVSHDAELRLIGHPYF